MTNAKKEFMEHTSENCTASRAIQCASICIFDYTQKSEKFCILPVGYSTEDLNLFLDSIDVEYDSGYGSQELQGTIWYTDGCTWSSRGEYDGAEWWDFNSVPEISKELVGNQDTMN